MPRGKRNPVFLNDGIGELAEITSAMNDIMIAIADLGREKAMLAMEGCVRLLAGDKAPPVLVPSIFGPVGTPPSIAGSCTITTIPPEPKRRTRAVRAGAQIADADEDETDPAVAKIDRAIKRTASTQGKNAWRERLSKVLLFAKSKSSICKQDVVREFSLSETDARSVLFALSANGDLNHVGDDTWTANERAKVEERYKPKSQQTKLSESRNATLEYVRSQLAVTSHALAAHFGISREAASVRLSVLKRKGHVILSGEGTWKARA